MNNKCIDFKNKNLHLRFGYINYSLDNLYNKLTKIFSQIKTIAIDVNPTMANNIRIKEIISLLLINTNISSFRLYDYNISGCFKIIPNNLTNFNLYNCHITDADADIILNHIRAHPNTYKLNLVRNLLTQVFIKKLIRILISMPMLVIEYLGIDINVFSLELFIFGFENEINLKELYVSGDGYICEYTRELISFLNSITKNRNINTIDIGGKIKYPTNKFPITVFSDLILKMYSINILEVSIPKNAEHLLNYIQHKNLILKKDNIDACYARILLNNISMLTISDIKISPEIKKLIATIKVLVIINCTGNIMGLFSPANNKKIKYMHT